MVRRDPMFPSIHSTRAAASGPALGPLVHEGCTRVGPILDGRIGDARPRQGHQFHHRGVQRSVE